MYDSRTIWKLITIPRYFSMKNGKVSTKQSYKLPSSILCTAQCVSFITFLSQGHIVRGPDLTKGPGQIQKKKKN